MLDSVNQVIKGQVLNYCESVSLGVKSVAVIPIQKRYKTEITDYIENNQKLLLEIEPLTDDWLNVYIYKYSFYKEVIKGLPDKPKTNFEHWILGKVFGYSDDSIAKFIEKSKL